MDKKRFQQTLLVFVLAVAWRALVILPGKFSGRGVEPMHGDFEAQRHWLELTVNLPVSQWYVNGPDNDLLYWGLDYPPLTALSSRFWGRLAKIAYPPMVELNTSHGIETSETVFFMRASVVISDLICYIPAALLFAWHYNSPTDAGSAANFLVNMAGLLLIDHGHFQYNCVSLGFALFAMHFLAKDWDCVGSMFFVLALNYKQMALYYAPVFFFYLLGKCFFNKELSFFGGVKKLFCIGVTVIAAFAVCWAPFLTSVDSVLAVVTRIFPVNRGLFEDKVANLWCAILPIIKLRNLFSQETLVKLSMAVTVLGLLPVVPPLLTRRSTKVLLLSMALCSLSFFLFSYQVHEKTILFPLLPIVMLFHDYPNLATFVSLMANFSMAPLLQRDGLLGPCIALTLVQFALHLRANRSPRRWLLLLPLAVCAAATVAAQTVPPPARYPDIHVMVNVWLSSAAFGCAYLAVLCRLYQSAFLGAKSKAD